LSTKKTYFSKETKTPVPLFCLPLRNQVNHFSSQSNAALFCSRWGLRLCLCLLDGEEINDYLQE